MKIIKAVDFAAHCHRNQGRSGYEALPYINHVIRVARDVAAIFPDDEDLIVAAILHDVLEDTEATEDMLRRDFGDMVTAIVLELTDDMTLERKERKVNQLLNAHLLSWQARVIRIIDKASNISDMVHYPVQWSVEKKIEYLDFAVKVVDKIRGTSTAAETHFDKIAEVAGEKLKLNEKS